jgi:hypothetical protein
MSKPIYIYEQIAKATNNNDLARVIAEAFEEVGLSELATKTNLSETELRLLKEIEGVRLELTKEIEVVRLELTKEIESVRLEIKEVELRLSDKIASQTTKTVAILSGYITFIAALFKFLN